MDSDKTKLVAPSVPELDVQNLLGFERVDARQMEAIEPEAAVAIAFNKRGEGPAGRQV